MSVFALFGLAWGGAGVEGSAGLGWLGRGEGEYERLRTKRVIFLCSLLAREAQDIGTPRMRTQF
jgi:hypothetical protein